MGEKLVKPIHNVFKQYRKMNLVNPYLFAKPFVSTWKTDNTSSGSSTTTQVKLPLLSTGSYNMTVSWGDGSSSTITTWNVGNTHTYAVAGTYVIKITGTCTGWQFNATGDRLKILSIQSWGKLRLGNSFGYFNGCSNLNLTAVTDILDLTGTTNLNRCFWNCTALTTVNLMNSWNLSGVTDISEMFVNCTSFNQNISNWDVSNVYTMGSTFYGCSSFNQPIGSWNVGNVTLMNLMFVNCSNFNQNIGAWNVSKVTDFTQIFQGTNFNNGGSPTIGNWVIKTTSGVTMASMFRSCPFNQNIGAWNVSSVNSMNSMFLSNTVFNQNISSWNVGNVTDMTSMFNAATAFNQPIGSWNVGNVTLMGSMFGGATAFNQNIGSWNISKVTSFVNFMVNKTAVNYSAANLDAIYNGWSALIGGVKPSISVNFYLIKYTAGASAGRAILTSAPNNWTITDGGI